MSAKARLTFKKKNLQSKVKKVSVNSTPEKDARNKKCKRRRDLRMLMRFSTLAFFAVADFAPVAEPFFVVSSSFFSGAALPRVSGSASIKNKVSADKSTKVRMAGAAYTFKSPSRVFSEKEGGRGLVAKYAPTGGPTQKQIAKAMPTCARAFDRLAGVVTSERMALEAYEQSSATLWFTHIAN